MITKISEYIIYLKLSDYLDIDEIIFNSHADASTWPYTNTQPLKLGCNLESPWAITTGILKIKRGSDWYSEDKFTYPEMLKLSNKIKLEVSPEADKAYRERELTKQVTELEIKVKGKAFKRKSIGIKGDPDQPLTDKELTDKYLTMATTILDRPKADKLLKSTLELDKLSSISFLTQNFGQK